MSYVGQPTYDGTNSVTHAFSINWNNGGASIVTGVSVTDTNESNVTIVTNNGDVDINQAFALDITKTTALLITSNATVTLRTNSYGSPANTLTIQANVPLVWFVGSPLAFPFTTNVANIHVNNASGQQSTLTIKALYHP